MQINEFRVRPVDRFVLTHYQADYGGPTEADPLNQRPLKSSARTIGEFPNVESAEEVGVALQALVPGSALITVDGRAAEDPPAALATAMAVRQPLQYVIVCQNFEVDTKAYYADYPQQAEQYRAQLAEHFDCDFRIFARALTDPVALAHRSVQVKPTTWPALDLGPSPATAA